eukprot:9467713-Pyramimonas_sp.AAC.2
MPGAWHAALAPTSNNSSCSRARAAQHFSFRLSVDEWSHRVGSARRKLRLRGEKRFPPSTASSTRCETRNQDVARITHTPAYNITSYHGSSCVNNGKGALNTPDAHPRVYRERERARLNPY